MDKPPRLDKRAVRAIEDALVHRQSCPRDMDSREPEDYARALAWAEGQLGKRRLQPRAAPVTKTPLEQWLDTHPEEPQP